MNNDELQSEIDRLRDENKHLRQHLAEAHKIMKFGVAEATPEDEAAFAADMERARTNPFDLASLIAELESEGSDKDAA
jgi:hypothetical protein